jgi:hypothetical protein
VSPRVKTYHTTWVNRDQKPLSMEVNPVFFQEIIHLRGDKIKIERAGD